MRNLWLIWKNPKTRRRFRVGTLSFDKNNKKYEFEYTNPELDEAKEGGFVSFPGFNALDKKYESDNLFPNITSRFPNPERPDYLEILNSYNLNSNSTDEEILEATKGRLMTDNFEFVPEFDKTRIEFDVAGIRHLGNFDKIKNLIQDNDVLKLKLDPENEHDKYSIKVCYSGDNDEEIELGFVPRYYSKQLTELLGTKKYSAMVKRIRFDRKIPDEFISVSVKLVFEQ
ncbi:hypothetical protein IJ380_02825 [Candidatus Saccharibacteria bacterium]|nr:hypothetical protein [Candidatus Saccharibacteria bacterium]